MWHSVWNNFVTLLMLYFISFLVKKAELIVRNWTGNSIIIDAICSYKSKCIKLDYSKLSHWTS